MSGSGNAPTAPVEASGSERESIKEALIKSKGWPHDLHPGPAADAILALLSARPLALGGQHSGGEAVNRECKQCGAFKSDLNAACTFCGSTTPARAEAQDEGAEMTRLLKLADSALANVTAFEDDARYIMGNTNYAITENARSEIRSFLLAQSAKTSVRPKALEILERLLDHSGARGSFDAMKHGDAVKDAEELLSSARSPGHTDLMVTPESIDAYMKDNPMEAKDEGAAGEIKSCPFCGGEAEIIHLDDDDNAGGSCVCCTKCQASGNVEFGRKENFVENWNRRSHPSPTPAADADRVRIAKALRKGINRLRGRSDSHTIEDRKFMQTVLEEVEAPAALKSTAAKEGGEAQGDAAPEAG